jgi:hypothetical protein
LVARELLRDLVGRRRVVFAVVDRAREQRFEAGLFLVDVLADDRGVEEVHAQVEVVAQRELAGLEDRQLALGRRLGQRARGGER